jgi:hypothetical protein
MAKNKKEPARHPAPVIVITCDMASLEYKISAEYINIKGDRCSLTRQQIRETLALILEQMDHEDILRNLQ